MDPIWLAIQRLQWISRNLGLRPQLSMTSDEHVIEIVIITHENENGWMLKDVNGSVTLDSVH